MKKVFCRSICFSFVLFCLLLTTSQVRRGVSAARLRPADAATRARVSGAYGKLPLGFEINRGQTGDDVRFLSRGPGYSLWLKSNEAVLTTRSGDEVKTIRMKFIGANPSPMIEGVDPLPGRSSYLIGADLKRWRTDIANYARARYREIYPGVDLVFQGNQRRLEYDFIIKPGADPNVIDVSFEGAGRMNIDRNEALALRDSGGENRRRKPMIYQEANGERKIVYSTLLGGSNRETARAIAVDAAGNVYLAGDTFSANFPVSGALQNGDPGQPGQYSTHAFVSKLNAAGTALIYSTWLGGAGQDAAQGIAVDAAGNAYVTGMTQSADFPLVNAAQSFPGANFFASADGAGDWRRGGTLAGITTLAVDPINSTTIYAGTVYGLYKSANGGGVWNKSGNGLPDQRAVTALLIDPKNNSTLYAATSAAAYLDSNPPDSATDGMIFKSADGGGAWFRIGASLTIGRVNTLAIDPADSKVIYAAASNGGVLRSADGGANWTTLNNGFFSGGQPPVYGATAIAIDSSNSSRMFALVNGGLFRSVNGGANWALNLMGAAPRALAMDSRNPSTLYAGTIGGNGNRSLFKTTDGGETWKAVGTGLISDNSSTFNLGVTALAIDPINPSIIYAGVEEVGDYFYKVYKSADGGESWSPSRKGLADASVQTLVIDPLTPSMLYAGFRVKTSSVAFVAKLNPAGSALLYSTYVCYGEGRAIAIDSSGAVYLAGMATFGSLPVTPGVVQEASGGGRPASTLGSPLTRNQPTYDPGHADAFVAKLNASGSAFVYATYLGGRENDKAAGLAVDAAGNVFITGVSNSPDFPVTPNAFQTDGASILSRKAWVAKLNPAGSALSYSTYLGTESFGEAIAIDGQGNSYVAGAGTLPFATASFHKVPGATLGAFVAKLKADGSSLAYAALLGGGDASVTAIAVDASGAATVAGQTSSTNFPVTSDALQVRAGGGVCGYYQFSPSQPRITVYCRDAFLARLNLAGTELVYSTYLGAGGGNADLGTGDETATALAQDAGGAIYLAGLTTSPNFPTTSGAFQTVSNNSQSLRDNSDAFVAKLKLEGAGIAIANTSAANYRGVELASESIIAAFGVRLATSTAAATAAPLPTSLAETAVRVRDSAGVERLAPLFFVSDGQVNYQMPPGTALGNAIVTIANGDNIISSGVARIVDVAPGLFTANGSGQGLPAATAQRIRNNTTIAYEPVARFDAQQNGFVPVPIDLGPEGDLIILNLYGTGFRYRSALSAVSVKIGGVDVMINYAGPQLQLVGLDQINAFIPRSMAGRGDVDVVVTVDGKTANTTRIAFK